MSQGRFSTDSQGNPYHPDHAEREARLSRADRGEDVKSVGRFKLTRTVTCGCTLRNHGLTRFSCPAHVELTDARWKATIFGFGAP